MPVFSPNIVTVIKSRRMRWVGHVACRGGERCLWGFGWEDNIKMDLREIG
jgi:hypothetical protein